MMPFPRRHIGSAFFAACIALAPGAPAPAQVAAPIGTYTSPQHRRFQPPAGQPLGPAAQASQAPAAKPAAVAAPVSAAVSPTPPSLLDKPAEPARIDLASGRLTIHADNSSLADILHRLTADSGMTVDGLGAYQRIFGTYGPGDPQEVLFRLLDGSGYNVLMLGRTATGTPKQLALSPRVKGLPDPGGPSRPQPVAQDEDNDDEYQQQPAAEMPAPPQPPQENQPQNGVRSPQQMLQELQMLRQQQIQQQQQPQQQTQPQPQP